MQPIFNRQGQTISWIRERELFNLQGISIGFLNNNAVFNLQSNYKGTFTSGFFRDRNGNAVAFIRGASNGPIPPIPSIPPIPPIPNIPPIAPIPSLGWSQINWNEFIN